MRFAPGDVVLRRHFQGDLLSRAWVGRVVADDVHGLWIWVASGSAHRDLGAADGRHIRDIPTLAEWSRVPKAYDERPWLGDTLMLHPSDGEFSVWLFFGPEFRRWYVNLELPTVRWRDASAAGVDTVDYDLDIVVDPDRAWRWKDEDEFAARLGERDLYWAAEESSVRAEGARLVKLVEAGEFPFDGTGTDFRPPADWAVPTAMPDGWDRPRAR
jgi:hypothetical protein